MSPTARSHLQVGAQVAGMAITLWPWGAPTGNAMVALALAVPGVTVAVFTLMHNRLGNFGIYPEPRAQARLVTSGPYRWVRHPMYSALLLLMIAAAAAHGHLLNVAGVLLVAVAVTAKARHEERYLLQRFAEYGAYRRRTRWFVPHVL